MGLNCSGCVECCGIVPVSFNELKTIQNHLKKMKPKEIKRLQKQKREPLQCMFVDTEKKQCSIYEARPDLCRKFGYIKPLPCPYQPEFATENDTGKKPIPVGVLGTTITWDNVFDLFQTKN